MSEYCARINYTPPEVTIATITEICRHHAHAIIFENIASILGIKVDISLEAIAEKLVHQHRGGYCYEQNILFYSVLLALGLEPRFALGRSYWNELPNQVPVLTHVFVEFTLAGRTYIADVGFGGIAPYDELLLGNWYVSTPSPVTFYQFPTFIHHP